jgi:hypothetical protein|nr:hypothetical protein [uncultured Acinetobacter sp.]
MVSPVINILDHYKQSFAFDDDEEIIKEMFIRSFELLFNEQLNDIFHYGMPHLGSANVVERFTKQDGLVVLRRPQSSEKIMRVIYANWKSLGSKRGFAFLKFVLQMLWPNQWEIVRLYHSITLIEQYPNLVTEVKVNDSFLTSRIFVLMKDSVDVNELKELTPILERLVPANIVPKVGVRADLGSDIQINLAAALNPTQVISAHYFY